MSVPSITPASALRPLVIWGGSGLAKALREFASALGYEVVAVFDNNPNARPPFAGVPLHHGKEGFAKWKAGFGGPPLAGWVAIGGGNARGRERLALQRYLEEQGVEIVPAVHPTAFVAKDAVLGKGCQVLAQAAVCTEVRLGDGCVIQTAASVDHESAMGDGVNLSPGVRIAGCVEVGSFTQFGVGAVVLPRVKIGSNAVIGAGALVTADVLDNAVMEGSPARIVGQSGE